MITNAAFAGWLAVAAALAQSPSTERGYLGVVTVQTAEGAIVIQVEPNSPAAQAGISAGDVIVAADDRAVGMQAPLHNLIMSKKPGGAIALRLRRGEKTLTSNLIVGVRPTDGRQSATRFKPRRDDDDDDFEPETWRFGPQPISQLGFNQTPGALPTVARPMLGITVQDPDATLRQKFNLGDTLGVLITEVRANSPASEVGLEVGDMLQWIGDKPVKDAAMVQQTVATLQPDTQVKLKVWRKGAIKEATVKVKVMAPPTTTPLVGNADQVAELQRKMAELTQRVETLEKALKIPNQLKSVPSSPTGARSKGGRLDDGLPSPKGID
jgi:C-terminal processing protease CtpA/Prc